jgi:hypothetical protein
MTSEIVVFIGRAACVENMTTWTERRDMFSIVITRAYQGRCPTRMHETDTIQNDAAGVQKSSSRPDLRSLSTSLVRTSISTVVVLVVFCNTRRLSNNNPS